MSHYIRAAYSDHFKKSIICGRFKPTFQGGGAIKSSCTLGLTIFGHFWFARTCVSWMLSHLKGGAISLPLLCFPALGLPLGTNVQNDFRTHLTCLQAWVCPHYGIAVFFYSQNRIFSSGGNQRYSLLNRLTAQMAATLIVYFPGKQFLSVMQS